ncbi:MAG TPA: DPP IV N-terminal domain-containing protein [Aggregatilineales bacterium]|nr:DPP IV N-terminal domain-containing protein [Aggregatilineales bacterium]
MLVRVIRLVDKTGNAVLKLVLAETSLLAQGLHVFVSTIGRIVTIVLYVVGRPVWWLFQQIWKSVNRTARTAAQQSSKTATQTIRSGMARRAARAEIQASVTEDPLRVQNRILSAGFVVLLMILGGVVLWATRPQTTSPQVNPGTSPLLASTDDSTIPDTVALSTQVPTATPLPNVLQARGSIAYVVRERGQDDLWAINIGSPNPIRITNSPSDERDPSWSPDGRRLAYASRQDGNWELYVYDLPSGQTVRLTYELSFQGAPHWSPDTASPYLVYESYQGENLDIYLVPADGSQAPLRVTDHPAPDFSPSWSPGGRSIAFVSWRDGNQDIFLFSLDDPRDSASVNLTQTPGLDENYPAWSPDGRLLAYSAVDQGIEKVFVLAANEPGASPQVIARGRAPSWSPDGTSLIYAVDSVGGTQLVATPYQQTGISTLVIGTNFAASNPVWSGQPLPAALVTSGGLASGVPQALFIEQEARQSDGLYRLGALESVEAPIPNLSDRVNDSFNALRRRTNQVAAWDFLGRLEDAFWRIDRPVQPGEERRNWLMTGRAFAIDRQLIRGFPPQVEVVREDGELDTRWRIYVRVNEDSQDGQFGEPLRRMPWDFLSRESGDLDAYNAGGRLRNQVPTGYYIDFTRLALDYGWESIPTGTDWRANQFSINYWLFRAATDLTWEQAMLELYTRDQLGGFVATPTPQPG